MEEELSTIVFNGVAVAIVVVGVTDFANIEDGIIVFSIPEDGIVVVDDDDDKPPREF